MRSALRCEQLRAVSRYGEKMAVWIDRYGEKIVFYAPALRILTFRECSDSRRSNERTNLENRLRAPKLLSNEWTDITYIIIYVSDLKLFVDL